MVLSTIWDLLTMQCDRHGQNVYLDESGQLTLIDLDQALGDAWRVCGFDSLFLPTSQKHAINLLGYGFVMKMPFEAPESRPVTDSSIMHVLDYRCHAPGGKIGKNYPPKLQQCLQDISSSTYRQVSVVRCTESLHAKLSTVPHRTFSKRLHHTAGSRSIWVCQNVQGRTVATAGVRPPAQWL